MNKSNRRYVVFMKSGRKFMVEEYGDPFVKWGNINPATKQLEKVSSKMSEVIDDSNTQITAENGFRNIVMLNPGTSPLGYIEALDSSGMERFETLDCGTYL
jgi:hypothetical protein